MREKNKNPSTRRRNIMMETDWERWGAIAPPTSWVNDWNEPYSEIYDWYPWMRKFYSRLEIEKDCISVRESVSLSSLTHENRVLRC